MVVFQFFIANAIFFFFVYGPVSLLWSSRAQSFNLSTLFQGKLPKQLTRTKCPYFHQ